MTTTIERALEAQAHLDKALQHIVRTVRRPHVIKLNVMVKRYQRELWQRVMSYQGHLSNSIGSGHHQTDVHHLISELADLGQMQIMSAASIGFQRALDDLVGFEWLKSYQEPVVAPLSVYKTAVDENTKYLRESLQPDLEERLGKADSDEAIVKALTAFHGRIDLYGHVLWRAAEQAYKFGMQEFFAYAATHKLKEVGTSSSGNYGHAGRPGEVGGSSEGNVTYKVKAGTNIKIASRDTDLTPQAHAMGITSVDLVHHVKVAAMPADALQTVKDTLAKNFAAVPSLAGLKINVVSANETKLFLNGKSNDGPDSGWSGETFIEPGNVANVLISAKQAKSDVELITSPGYITGGNALDDMEKTSADHISHTITHELGHVFEMTNTAEFQRDVKDLYVTVKHGVSPNVFRPPISGYAMSNEHEFFAEAYLTYVTGHADRLPKAVAAFMDKTFHGAHLAEAVVQKMLDTKHVFGIICDRIHGRSTVIYSDGSRETSTAPMRESGTAASGNWDHLGRPGLRGGSTSVSGTYKALRAIAKIHAGVKHSPDAQDTSAAYKAFIKETHQQYDKLKAEGYKFKFGTDDPYRTSQDMTKAVNDAKILAVYNVVDLPEGHPLAAMSPYEGQTENTIFRAVHDMNGHYLPGNTFGQRGEFKAYQAHAKMYSDAAIPAMAAETLAQSAWQNHGANNESLAVQDRPYAEQKAYAFPLKIAKAMRDGKYPNG